MQELQSGDLFVADSDQYSDHRTQLIDWETYKEQIMDYGTMLNIPIEAKAFSSGLKKMLSDTAILCRSWVSGQ